MALLQMPQHQGFEHSTNGVLHNCCTDWPLLTCSLTGLMSRSWPYLFTTWHLIAATLCCCGITMQLKANMMGTEYLLRGRGRDGTMHKGFNKQLLAVNYNPTINHIHAAPRTMTAVLPVPDSRVGDLAVYSALGWLSPNGRQVVS